MQSVFVYVCLMANFRVKVWVPGYSVILESSIRVHGPVEAMSPQVRDELLKAALLGFTSSASDNAAEL